MERINWKELERKDENIRERVGNTELARQVKSLVTRQHDHKKCEPLIKKEGKKGYENKSFSD